MSYASKSRSNGGNDLGFNGLRRETPTPNSSILKLVAEGTKILSLFWPTVHQCGTPKIQLRLSCSTSSSTTSGTPLLTVRVSISPRSTPPIPPFRTSSFFRHPSILQRLKQLSFPVRLTKRLGRMVSRCCSSNVFGRFLRMIFWSSSRFSLTVSST